jgi:DNA-binding Lrp family transcriptional regulator
VSIDIDELDIRILRELSKNAKSSYHKLASILNVSPTTILNRIKRLESLGLIVSYSAIINHKMLGYTITAIIEISCKQGMILEIEQEIARDKAVCAIYDTTGVYDAIIIAKFRDIEDLDIFIKAINKKSWIDKTNTHIVLNTIKEDFRML